VYPQLFFIFAAEAASDRQVRQGASARKELLRMKMYMRMIAVPVSEEFDDEVYSEAMEMVVEAAVGVASVSGYGPLRSQAFPCHGTPSTHSKLR